MNKTDKKDEPARRSTPIPPKLESANVTGQDTPRDLIKTRAATSEDEKSRLDAVSELGGDVEALKFVVMNSKYRDSRVAAAGSLLENKEAVVEILVGENKLAASAVLETLLRNPEIMKDIAKSSMNSAARLIVIGKIREKSDLVELASVSIYADSRDAALEKLREMPDAVEEVACISSYNDTRLKALSIINTSIEALERLAVKCLYEDTRNTAQEMLVKIRLQS